jgi:signal transduction histidine kinase
MTFLGFTGVINFITSLLLGSFVLFKNSKGPQNRYYFCGNLSVALYSLGYFFWQFAKDGTTIMLWFKLLVTGIILINISFLYFAFSFLGIIEKKKKILLGCLVINAIFVILNFRSLLYFHLEPRYNLGYWPIPTLFFHIYLIFWFWQVFYGLRWLLEGLKTHSGIKREQIKYFTLASMIGFVGGVTNWPMWYGIYLPPYANILISLYVAIVTYAILRHQLMDIEVIIKKSLVFAGMFVFSFGVFVVVTLLVSRFLGGNSIVSLALSALIIIIGLRPIETWLVNSTDKFLFQKKYEYKQIIRAFIDKVATELNLNEVVSSTLKILDQALHPYALGIFILNKVEDKYQLYDSSGLEDKNITFNSDSRLVAFLKKTHNPAVIKQIDGISGANPEALSDMSQLKAVLVLPLLLRNDLIGFISLGRKKSDEDYTKDDLDVLLDLARTESITVGNAQLLTEAAQAERRAAIGTMSAGINHEIGNPLNIMSTRIQVFKLERQKGYFKDTPKEKALDQAEAALDECLKQSDRISDITKKLSNFAKPSKEFKPQLINILEEIEETLSMVGHDLELEKIKIEKNISSDLYNILADKRELQQIFFNLIRNAAQAITGEGSIAISALNTSNDKVHIEIRDTGKGIPEDKVNRIFEPFFTTKGPNKGTGLGLSIVRQLAWKNKGEISFKSRVNVGTTFILEFPKGA